MGEPSNIRRAPHDKNNPYFMLGRYAIEDTRLGMKALAIHTYLMSKPDDWNVNTKQLMKRFNCGVTAVRTALRELRECDYLEDVIKKSKKTGRITAKYTLIHERAPMNQVFRHMGSLIDGKQDDIVSNVTTVNSINEVISLSPDGDDKDATSQRDMFGVVQKITGADAKLMASRIGKCAKQLIEAGYTIEMMQRFGKDVWQHDWRWQRSMARPTFAQLLAEVGKLKHGRTETIPDEERRFYMSIDPNTGEKHYSEVPRD